MEKDFAGWDWSAAWTNTRFDVRHRRDFEKIAIVGAPTWENWCVKLAGFVIKGELRTFRRDQLSAGWDWIRA